MWEDNRTRKVTEGIYSCQIQMRMYAYDSYTLLRKAGAIFGSAVRMQSIRHNCWGRPVFPAYSGRSMRSRRLCAACVPTMVFWRGGKSKGGTGAALNSG